MKGRNWESEFPYGPPFIPTLGGGGAFNVLPVHMVTVFKSLPLQSYFSFSCPAVIFFLILLAAVSIASLEGNGATLRLNLTKL